MEENVQHLVSPTYYSDVTVNNGSYCYQKSEKLGVSSTNFSTGRHGGPYGDMK